MPFMAMYVAIERHASGGSIRTVFSEYGISIERKDGLTTVFSLQWKSPYPKDGVFILKGAPDCFSLLHMVFLVWLDVVHGAPCLYQGAVID